MKDIYYKHRTKAVFFYLFRKDKTTKEIFCLIFGSAVLNHYEWSKLMTGENIIQFQVIVPKKV